VLTAGVSRFSQLSHAVALKGRPRKSRTSADAGFALPDANLCEFLTAYLPAIFGRIGAKDVKCVHSKCRVRGDSVCSFQLEWR
jgi:hypothetical protein